MQNPALARKHLEQRLAPLRQADSLSRPPRGWIRAIRDALGMTGTQLAGRIGVDQSRIPRLEKAEADGAITLKTLRHVAEGLGCTVVYALVPNEALDEVLRERAGEIADRQLARVHHTMKLENQALGAKDLQTERERLVNALMAGNPRRLWDTP
jgi:predicted DNA-binding mobile mystery protein A